MDSTHKANHLDYKLFTIMLRDEYANWIFGAHMLSNHEHGDNIAQFL